MCEDVCMHEACEWRYLDDARESNGYLDAVYV